jgi:hypothetical protein
VHFLPELPHLEVDYFARFAGRTNNWRNGERIDVSLKPDSATCLRRRRHSLLHRRHCFGEGKSSGRREAAFEKAASTQHRLKPESNGMLARGEFIRSDLICLLQSASFIDSSLILLRHDEAGPDLTLRQIE